MARSKGSMDGAWSILGLGMLLFALTIGGVSVRKWYDADITLPTPEESVEGVVVSDNLVETPGGDHAAYVGLELFVHKRIKRKKARKISTKLWKTASGELTLDVTGSTERITIAPPDPWTAWVDVETEDEAFVDLDHVPMLDPYDKWRKYKDQNGFVTHARALHKGDSIVVKRDGDKFVKLWLGKRDTLQQDLNEARAVEVMPSFHLAGGLALAGLAFLLYGERATIRRRFARRG